MATLSNGILLTNTRNLLKYYSRTTFPRFYSTNTTSFNMTQIPKEQKALITDKDFKLIVSTIPVTGPSANQILVKAKAFALNPADAKLVPYVKTANVNAGFDVAGVVVKVGENVKGYKIGDSVSLLNFGFNKPLPYPGAFAEYVIANPLTTYKYNYELKSSSDDKIPIGEIDTFEAAASFTTSLATAGVSLYQTLGLKKGNDYSNESILIWSGASATGLIAIQLAKWLGFKNIVVTASKSRFESLKSLGATNLYDYHDDDIVSEIRKDFGDDIIYGFDTYSNKDSFSKTYLALSDSRPVFLVDLAGLTEADLTVSLKSSKATLGSTRVLQALGENPTPQGQDSALKHTQLHDDILPYINDKKFKHIPITVLPNGFEGLKQGIDILNSGKYGFEKFVARI